MSFGVRFLEALDFVCVNSVEECQLADYLKYYNF